MRRGALAASVAVVFMVLVPCAQAAVPSVDSTAASEVGSESARLEGIISPNGLHTTYSFEYVALASYSESGFATAIATPSTAIATESESEVVGAVIGDLSPDTTYYFQLSATNLSGTTRALLSNFTTSHGSELSCEGDDCQILPPQPVDPTLTTLLSGLGNPAPHYYRLNHPKKRHKAKPKPKKHHKHKPQAGHAR